MHQIEQGKKGYKILLVLRIHDNYDPNTFFEFRLSNVEFQNAWIYTLNSENMQHFELKFILPQKFDSFHDGYSTSVYLIKNKFFAQKDVVEIRVNELSANNGRIGYIVQLNSIFDEKIISVNKHLFSFLYYAIGNIFYNLDFKQTKNPSFSKTTFEITDFFDEDVLIFITCDQDTNQISNFKIDSYLPSLYQHGFYIINELIPTTYYNTSSRVRDNYSHVLNNQNKAGYNSLKLEKVSDKIANEDYLYGIFNKQLLKKSDQETRFLILYQIVEILISKILTNELTKKVCGLTIPLEAFKLKSAIEEEVRESARISHLFNSYTNSDNGLKNELNQEIYRLLQYLQFPDYLASFNPLENIFHSTFYDYRNKLLHSHRSFRNNTLDEENIYAKMENINSLVELLIIEVVNSFHY